MQVMRGHLASGASPRSPFEGHLAETHRHRIHPDHRLRADRHRTGLRVRLFRHPGLQGAPRRRLPRRADQQQSGHHHDRPGHGGPDLRRAHHRGIRGEGHPARAPRRAAAHARGTDGPERRRRARRVGHAGPLRGRAHRRQARGDQDGGGPGTVPAGHGAHRPGGAPGRLRADRRRGLGTGEEYGLSRHHPTGLHPGRRGREHRAERVGICRGRRMGPVHQSHHRGADRGVGHRLEGIRTRGHARPGRQRGDHLLHRKFRPHGRAHRRQHHGRARADPHGQGIPGAPGRLHQGDPGDRRGDGRIEHPVRRQSRKTAASWPSR